MQVGTRLGAYEITAKLGEGGMGEVYRATDSNLGRQVAIKVLPEAFATDAERLARFEREARTLASLNHPNIAGVHGLDRSRRRRAGDGAGRRPDACRSPGARAAVLDRGAADRRADCARPRRGPRAGYRAPRSQAGQHQGARRRYGEGARFRVGESGGARRRGALGHDPLADDHVAGDDGRGRPARNRGLHEPGAGESAAGRQAYRHLGVRRRALRDAHRPSGLCGRRCVGGAGVGAGA